MRGRSLVLLLLVALVVVPAVVAPEASAYGGCRPWITWESYRDPATGVTIEKYPRYRGMVC